MAKESRWMDRLSLLFSLVVVGVVFAVISRTMMSSGSVGTWQLIRAAGIAAYIMLTLSMAWGLAVSSRVIKDWSPGVLSMLLHSTLSWLAVVFSLGHALLLLVDSYFKYTLSDILIPFTGPYRPLAVGLGTLACWLAFAVAISFALKDRMGHRAWKLLHFTSYGLFGMVTLHVLMAGSDGARLGIRVLLGICVALVVGLLGYRLVKTTHASTPVRKERKPTRTAQLVEE